jgi:hypothetical protein
MVNSAGARQNKSLIEKEETIMDTRWAQLSLEGKKVQRFN